MGRGREDQAVPKTIRPRSIRPVVVAVATAAACAAAATALGCSAAAIGLGSVGVGVAALVAYLLAAVGGGTACSSRGPVGTCLSIVAPPPEDVVEPPGPCLQPPYPEPCLEYAPIEPCLEYVPVEPHADECLSIAPSPCLSMPAPPADAGAVESEDARPPAMRLCLSVMPIEGEVVRPGGKAVAPDPRAEAASAHHLAAAGVLTEDQVRRLARLRGGR